jgi:YfiH family protein
MPVFVSDRAGRGIAVAHAGWRGLAAGVLQNTVRRLRERIGETHADLLAYLGPAIGPRKFEVGGDVLAAMQASLPQAARAFVPLGNDKFLADLFTLAGQALAEVGVREIDGGGECTASDPARFYSHRRDRVTGRHAALIWLVP